MKEQQMHCYAGSAIRLILFSPTRDKDESGVEKNKK